MASNDLDWYRRKAVFSVDEMQDFLFGRELLAFKQKVVIISTVDSDQKVIFSVHDVHILY